MPYLFSILMKVSLISGIFYCWYVAALRNKRMHQYNRFYLLAATGLSLLLPFFQLPIHYGARVQSPALAHALKAINMTGEEKIITGQAGHAIQAMDVIAIAYAAVCLVLFIRIGWALYRIARLKYKNKSQRSNDVDLVMTTASSAPFSFMRTLYWRADMDMNSDEGKRVLAHERAHIEQYHTIDKLAMEVITAVCWVNPFFHLIKRELGMVHEFIADEQAVSGDVPALAAMLLSSAGYGATPLVNSFYYSPIKRRLNMLTKNKDTRFKAMRKLFFIPLVATAVGSFCLTATARTTGAAHKKVTVVLDAGHGGRDAGAIHGDVMEKTMTLAIVKRLATLAKDYNIDVQLTRKETSILRCNNAPTPATKSLRICLYRYM
jgi:beta-lactamase regulating signal transducer with metallopeptidase domain